MGVTLEFTTAEPVSADVERAIRADATRSLGAQPWVRCEPPHFHNSLGEGYLQASSKLNLFPLDEAEIAEAESADCNDLRELLRRFAEWSREHGIIWQVSLMNHRVGEIRQGSCDDDVFGAIETMANLPLNPTASDFGQF